MRVIEYWRRELENDGRTSNQKNETWCPSEPDTSRWVNDGDDMEVPVLLFPKDGTVSVSNFDFRHSTPKWWKVTLVHPNCGCVE